MANGEARRHHFVPRFLLEPWSLAGELRGYWWSDRANAVVCKQKGTRAFCQQLDLLTLRAHELGRDALETIFFGEIDTRGALARDVLIAAGVAALTHNQRCDFARLLLSLDVRRPSSVELLRGTGRKTIADALDSDPEILAAMAERGLACAPSIFAEENMGMSLEDRALAMVQGLVDNPDVGGRLINAYWHVVRLAGDDQSLVLSDRPLIRLRGYNHPGAAWVLPLTPKIAFVAVNHEANLRRVQRATANRFVKGTNVSSARQSERFIFSIDPRHVHWIEKYLKANAAAERAN